MLLGIFKIALRLEDRHVIIIGNLKVFNTLTLKQFSEKCKPFLKNLSTVFFKVLRLITQHFHTKLLCQKPMLRQIEWGVQNEPITKNGVLPELLFLSKNFVSVYEPRINI